MKLAWLTDVHLDWLETEQVDSFFDEVRASGADGILLTGDIALAPEVLGHVEALATRTARPVWFVLGNHDYYDGTIADVRAQAADLTRRGKGVTYLPAADVVTLAPGVALVGHDGWCDGRAGSGAASTVVMNDAFLIGEFSALLPHAGEGGFRTITGWWDEFMATQAARFRLMRDLAAEGTGHLHRVVTAALETHEHVVVLTHFPPFADACWHRGAMSDPDWLPHLACAELGRVLASIMKARPDRQMTVLSGHTHSAHEMRVLPNLLVRTGEAHYGKPAIQRILTVS